MIRSILTALIAIVVGAGLLAPAAPAQAQSAERCFSETGYCISGPIRQYWERNGGLPVFGYPITPQRQETVEGRSLQVQWFERDRLEIQADGRITAGRLGARYLELTGRSWQRSAPMVVEGCRWFEQTGHEVCGSMLSYWERNGGLERFGYPLTDLISERIGDREYQVQYFERRRMEYHPELGGTPHFLQLGLLGREVLERTGASACGYASLVTERTLAALAGDLGCFRPYNGVDERVTMAVQPFQGGEMIWLPPANGNLGMILVLFSERGAPTSWGWFGDYYVAGEALPPATPPPGLFAPQQGFGKLWHTVPDVQARLGWALAPERAVAGEALNQLGRGGFSWAIYRADSDLYYLLRAAGTVSLLPPRR